MKGATVDTITPIVVMIMTNVAALHAESIFPDKNLEAVVRRQVHDKRDNDKPLTLDDVRNISTIDGTGMTITDLTGLEHCTSLAELKLADNRITDLSPLKGLKRLQSLTLARNDIADISPLSDLVALQYLDLSHNQVADATPLKKLTKLNTLYLTGNRISDVTPLSGLKAWSVYLGSNPISDLTPIGKLSGVTTLELSDTGLADLSPLTGLDSVNMLLLQNNKIRDLSPLVKMCEKDLEGDQRFAPYLRVYLSGNSLGSVAKEQVSKLEELGVRVE